MSNNPTILKWFSKKNRVMKSVLTSRYTWTSPQWYHLIIFYQYQKSFFRMSQRKQQDSLSSTVKPRFWNIKGLVRKACINKSAELLFYQNGGIFQNRVLKIEVLMHYNKTEHVQTFYCYFHSRLSSVTALFNLIGS